MNMKQRIVMALMLIFIVPFIISTQVKAAPTPDKKSFAWDQVLQNTDGSVANITGFIVYCGASSGNYTISYDVNNGAARTTLISNVIPGSGKFYCAMTAYSSLGESGYSNELFLTVTSGVVKAVVPLSPGSFRTE